MLVILGPVLYTHIFEPSSVPVSAYKLLWIWMLVDSSLLVIFGYKHGKGKEYSRTGTWRN